MEFNLLLNRYNRLSNDIIPYANMVYKYKSTKEHNLLKINNKM